jgi:D-3-phosphoglycerate dehydrogenase / 2-oxoglutarate reductase
MMTAFKVVLTDQVFPTVEVEREMLRAIDAEIEILDDSSRESIGRRATDADALLTTYAAIDARLMESLVRCRIIARYGIGVDNIDLDAAKERGIVVTNVPDYCVDEVADHTIALLLTATRKIVAGDRVVRSGGWGISELRPIHRLRSRTLGLVGFGHIGRAVSVRANALGLSVKIYDPYIAETATEGLDVQRVDDLDELLRQSDIVSVHAPLVPATSGMFDAAAIANMKDGAVLINTSRGPIVETAAVTDALRAGRLGAAALDVFDSEPPDPAAIEGLDNLVATPHSAFYSEESIQESQRKAAEAIVDVLQGRAPRYRIV